MEAQKQFIKAFGWGVIASFFLSSTFIINSVISGAGGHWTWTANLRTLFLIPILALVLLFTKQLKTLFIVLKKRPWVFVKWGTVGFGILYTSLSVASLMVPGWMVAATFQINILAGMLLSPFVYKDERKFIPKKSLLISVLIVLGVLVMQFENLTQLDAFLPAVMSFFLVLIGAIVWPLGNRKLMVVCEEEGLKLNAIQRVLGMSIGCIPLMIVIGMVGFVEVGLPSQNQVMSSFYSAIFSGFFGGVAFYKATQMIHQSPIQLAAVEATQVFEIIFALIGEMFLMNAPIPGIYGQVGMMMIAVGILIHLANNWKRSKKWVLQLKV